MAFGWLRRRDAVPRPGAATIPEGMRVYAVGDIHGRLDCLSSMRRLIIADLSARPVPRPVVVFLGDYVDRGPESRGVIDALSSATWPGVELRFLCGNHEQMMLGMLDDPNLLDDWRAVGGIDTLHSYGVDVRQARLGRGAGDVSAALAAALPVAHRRFLDGLEVLLLIGGYAFVHAGVRPGVALDAQRSEDLLWIREPFLDHAGDFGAVVVHGHTPVDAVDRRPNRVNTDTGAFMTGRLSAIVLEGTDQRVLVTEDVPA